MVRALLLARVTWQPSLEFQPVMENTAGISAHTHFVESFDTLEVTCSIGYMHASSVPPAGPFAHFLWL